MKSMKDVTYFCGWSVRLLWEERRDTILKTGRQKETGSVWYREWALTHGTLPHQADELMRAWLSCHPQEDFSEWVVGKPAVLRGTRNVNECSGRWITVQMIKSSPYRDRHLENNCKVVMMSLNVACLTIVPYSPSPPTVHHPPVTIIHAHISRTD